MDAFLNWFLPMHCNWFILLCLFSFLATMFAWLWAVDHTTSKYRRFCVLVKSFVAIAVTAISIAIFGWLFYSASRDPEFESEERLEIKSVTYPDGKVVQMFTFDGVNYNCNSTYSCSPPPGSYIRRVVYKKVYVGVFWPTHKNAASATNKDAFFLVMPNAVENKAENLRLGQ